MSKIVKVQAPDGSIIKVEGPDDATDEQFLEQGRTLYEQQKPYESPRYGPTGPNALEVASDQAANVLKGIPQAVTGIPSAIGGLYQAFTHPASPQLALSAIKPFATAAQGAAAYVAPNTVKAPSDEDWQQAAQAGGTMLGGAAVGEGLAGTGALVRGLRNYPQSLLDRASVKFDALENAVGKKPIDTTAADQVAAEAENWQEHGGGRLPDVFRRYIENQTNRSGAMPFSEGRQFGSAASDLSAKALRSMNRTMKAKVNDFAQALREANREPPAAAGMGDLYDQAMQEWGRGRGLQRMSSQLATALARHSGKIATGAGIGAGYELLQALRGQR